MVDRSKVGRASKRKGNTFERKIANIIREVLDAPKDRVQRTPLSGGMYEKGDLIVKEPYTEKFPWYVECKNRESWTWPQLIKKPTDNPVFQWFEKTLEECHPYDGRIPRKPLLIFTKNRSPICVMLRKEDINLFVRNFDRHFSFSIVIPYESSLVYIVKLEEFLSMWSSEVLGQEI